MCAYNVRRSKQVDHEPARGTARTLNLVGEAAIFAISLGMLYCVYWLVRRYLL